MKKERIKVDFRGVFYVHKKLYQLMTKIMPEGRIDTKLRIGKLPPFYFFILCLLDKCRNPSEYQTVINSLVLPYIISTEIKLSDGEKSIMFALGTKGKTEQKRLITLVGGRREYVIAAIKKLINRGFLKRFNERTMGRMGRPYKSFSNKKVGRPLYFLEINHESIKNDYGDDFLPGLLTHVGIGFWFRLE